MTRYDVLDAVSGDLLGYVFGYSVDHAWVRADLKFAGRIAVIHHK
jgi:hypothetical protein